MLRTTWILAACACAPLSAQLPVITPLMCTVNEGSALVHEPFTGPARVQQITADLTGAPRLVQALMFRRDGLMATNARYVARTVDLEVLCGDSSYANASATFAANYFGAPTVVAARRMFNLPDLTTLPKDVPAATTVILPFDSGYSYAGRLDLLYELRCWSSTSSNPYPIDAVSLRGLFTTRATSQTVSLDWSIDHGPSSTTAGLLVGLTNPNLPVPSLCPNTGNPHLLTDGVVASYLGFLDALGRWTLPTINVPFSASLVGATLTSQAVGVDPSQQGLGVAASNGGLSYVAETPSPFQITRIVATGTGAPTATTGLRTPGFGAVTRYN